MTPVLVFVSAGVGFAAAGFAGTRVGTFLADARTPFADGPAAVAAPAWPFVTVAALAGAFAALHGVPATQLAVFAFLAVALCAAAFTDLRCGAIPDVCTLVPLGAIIVAALVRHEPAPLIGAVVVGVPFAAAAALSHGRGMGWGDVKLVALGGALLGARDAAYAFFGACVASYVWSMITHRRTQPTAFAPYLVGALAVTVAIGHPV